MNRRRQNGQAFLEAVVLTIAVSFSIVLFVRLVMALEQHRQDMLRLLMTLPI